MQKNNIPLLMIGLTMCLLVSSCNNQNPTVTTVPKEAALTYKTQNLQETGVFITTTPSHWVEKQSSKFQTHLFLIGQNTQLSIAKLPRTKWNRLMNINRWRAQLNLPKIRSLSASLAGNTISIRNKNKEILVTIIQTNTHTIFIRANGIADEIRKETGNIQEFIQNLEFN